MQEIPKTKRTKAIYMAVLFKISSKIVVFLEESKKKHVIFLRTRLILQIRKTC